MFPAYHFWPLDLAVTTFASLKPRIRDVAHALPVVTLQSVIHATKKHGNLRLFKRKVTVIFKETYLGSSTPRSMKLLIQYSYCSTFSFVLSFLKMLIALSPLPVVTSS